MLENGVHFLVGDIEAAKLIFTQERGCSQAKNLTVKE